MNTITFKLKNGRSVSIPEKEIKTLMASLDVPQSEAIEIWLCDNDYEVDAEQQELDEKAKGVKIDHGVAVAKRGKVERVRKENPDKQEIIKTIANALLTVLPEIDVRNPEKYIDFTFNDVEYTINLVAHRKKG